MMLKLLRRLYYVARGFSTVSLENEEQLLQLLGTGVDFRWISSFPRSGNTWTRLVIAEYLLRSNGIEQTDIEHHVKEIIPDFARHPINKNADFQPPLIIKTHDNFHQLSAKHGKFAKSKIRCLYLFRKPEDVVTSFFHYNSRSEESLENNSLHSIDHFALNRVDSWNQHVKSYLEQSSNSTFFVAYESLLAEPQKYFANILNWLGLAPQVSCLAAAIESNSFSNLQTREKQELNNGTSPFYRLGKSGGGQLELQENTLEQIRLKTEHTYSQACQRAESA